MLSRKAVASSELEKEEVEGGREGGREREIEIAQKSKLLAHLISLIISQDVRVSLLRPSNIYQDE